MTGCRALSDNEVSRILKSLERARDRALFILGVKSGFRISELLSLRVSDVFQYDEVAARVRVERRNMKKKTEGREVLLHPEARAAIAALIKEEELSPKDFLFQSQKGSNKALGRIQAWRILKEVAKANRLQGKVATHSMRKTFATKIYDRLDHDLLKTQKALGHRSINSTVSYLAFRQEEIDEAILDI